MRVALSLAFVMVAVMLATASSLSETGPSNSMPDSAQAAGETVQQAMEALAAWPFAGR